MEAAVEPLLPSAEALDRDRVVEADSDVGWIWLERTAELMTPAIIEHGRWAPDLTALMRNVLGPGMTFVDTGANVGYLSVLAAKLVGEAGEVFCVEADPANVAILRANLWRNDCANARVLPVAAWSEATELYLKTIPEGGAGSSVFADYEQDSTVPAFRLDQLIDGPVDYLKVDCEGTDHQVISGAAGLLTANPSMLITAEFMAEHMPAAIPIYKELGLKPYEIRVDGRLERTSYRRVGRAGNRDPAVVFDYALVASRPGDLVKRHLLPKPLRDAGRPAAHRVLRMGGDLLEHVPARWRPRIRFRDRDRGAE
jgi:FkbM family methyltransferase